LTTMANKDKPPTSISELIDRLDVLRNELLSIQTSLEKMEYTELQKLAIKKSLDSKLQP
jgi:hypothetical protein